MSTFYNFEIDEDELLQDDSQSLLDENNKELKHTNIKVIIPSNFSITNISRPSYLQWIKQYMQIFIIILLLVIIIFLEFPMIKNSFSTWIPNKSQSQINTSKPSKKPISIPTRYPTIPNNGDNNLDYIQPTNAITNDYFIPSSSPTYNPNLLHIPEKKIRPSAEPTQATDSPTAIPTEAPIMPVISVANTNTRGMCLCASERMLVDAYDIIDQVRNVWKSNLNIAIIHCNEIDESKYQEIKDAGATDIVNICTDANTVIPKEGFGRLRSWFCKAGALILSPYQETIVSDLDVVWYKNPEVVFNSPAYKSTGSTFFRDRIYTTDDHQYQIKLEAFISKEGNFEINQELGQKMISKGGFSLFWRNVANPTERVVGNFQDSSVIVLDRLRFPKTLAALARIIPTFDYGYGDKEIYWIAATIAQEEFSFEPFICASYGNCGLLMHYDPNDIVDPENSKPLYLNGEWLLEKISVLGKDLEYEYPPPTVVTADFKIYDIGMSHWCTCGGAYGAQPEPCRVMTFDDVNQYTLRAQWERLSRGKSRDGSDCMPIFKEAANDISKMLDKWYIPNGYCPKYGCVYTPIEVNPSYITYSDSFCDPISFQDKPSDDFAEKARNVQIPPTPRPIVEKELLKGSSWSVYLVVNGTLHEFPNAVTFEAMGFEWANIHSIPDSELRLLPFGDSLPDLTPPS